MASEIFITGTDTGAGKTWVTAAAVRALHRRGVAALALKPIACGLDDAGRNEDVDALLAAQSLSDADAISLYRYALPAAPSQAAAAEGEAIEPERLLAWCAAQTAGAERCLIEGVGGLMAPVCERWLVCDWIEAMPACELWLVVGCRLGAINQVLLTLDKLQRIGRPPTRVFFNATLAEHDAWIEPTRQAVAPFLPAGCEIITLGYRQQPTSVDI